MPDVSIPCALYRGGTSRGLLFIEEHMSYPRHVLDGILLEAFGSPDPRQINGVGGGTSLTSKAMIVGRDPSPGADVRMTFAQVSVNAAMVDWGGNCGNMTTAVGLFAIDSGLVPAVEPVTVVTIRSVNTGALVRAHVPVRDGAVLTQGDYAIAGVPGTAPRIDLEWLEPGGTVKGALLPTGHTVDRLRLADGRQIDVSIVDAANAVVFCDASAVGVASAILPAALDAEPAVMQTLEEIRSMAAELLGLVSDRTAATRQSPGLPKVAFVGRPASYLTTAGDTIAADRHDLHARLLSMQTAHRSYAGTGGIATAVAALLPGTVVHACAEPNAADPGRVRIGHPAGVLEVEVKLQTVNGRPHVASATVARTARRIMSGTAWVSRSLAP